MKKITPYLNFPGNAQEALDMYADAFGGSILSIQHFGDVPDMSIDVALKEKVLHAAFQAGELFFMASDVMESQEATSGTNTNLSLDFEQIDEMEAVFKKLSIGAHITMQLQDTFWGARFGMLQDRFGINWMFNYDYPQEG